MSFSSDVKDTVINSPYKSSCCRRALLQGILAAKGYVANDKYVYINFEKKNTIDLVLTLIKEFYGKDAEIESLPKGGRGKRIVFDSKAAKRYIEEISENSLSFASKCTACQGAFLRGVFLASGRVSDPNKQFCLEFSLGNRIEAFLECFEELGLDLKINERKTERILYTKNSSVIEDFFVGAELNDTAYTFMNIKIANEFLNNANRLRNFDTVNISKAVNAANPQYQLIKKLTENNLIGLLPEELHDTARLRLENPDMSLSQLARCSIPPISKSGITHRMQKIMKLGTELAIKYNL
ncbi:MAG: DNA-binding protein WhiA [Clostridia bacterium]|nr:DNA-binding protein WhiA [Clostridia bacterium]